LKLHAVSVLFVALAATFPIRAAQNVVPQPQATSVDPIHAAVELPDFVPVINYDQFLLASHAEGFGGTDGISSETRSAAEALSAKFAGPRARSGSEMLRAVAQQDPLAPSLLDAPEDPKLQMQVADLSDTDDADDPAKAAERPAVAERASTSDARSPKSVVRRHHGERAATSRSRRAKHSVVRRQRSRVASADATSQRSGPVYNGIGADLQRLVGFGSLTPDNRLTTN
jgi:hypothetical protein